MTIHKLGRLKNGNAAAPITSAWSARRCGAKTRAGTPCKNPCVKGRPRCRLHGGSRRSGAPMGNQNAYRHGYYTAENLKARRGFRDQ